MAAELTAARLRELLDYDPETGVFRWRVKRGNMRSGSVAGTVHAKGYVQIRIGEKIHKAHRLAFLHVHGEMPGLDVDHINGVRSDNRMANLRQVTNAENQQNRRRANANNAAGLLGVTFDAARGLFQARIMVARKGKSLGRFESAEEAYRAYLTAKEKVHPFATITAAAA